MRNVVRKFGGEFLEVSLLEMEEGEGGYSRWSIAELGMRLGIEFGGEEG